MLAQYLGAFLSSALVFLVYYEALMWWVLGTRASISHHIIIIRYEIDRGEYRSIPGTAQIFTTFPSVHLSPFTWPGPGAAQPGHASWVAQGRQWGGWRSTNLGHLRDGAQEADTGHWPGQVVECPDPARPAQPGLCWPTFGYHRGK